MASHIYRSFCTEERYNPYFKPVRRASGVEPMSAGWAQQFRKAERIDPEPDDLMAIRGLPPGVRHPPMPDFISIYSVPVVSDAFRQLMLELEPDKHQFLPIALHDEAERLLPGRYWLMNSLQCRDAVIKPEKLKKWHSEGHRFPELIEFSRINDAGSLDLHPVTFLNRSLIEGLYLWRPTVIISTHEMFLSDELMRRIRRAKLRKLTVQPAVEVSIGSLQ